MSIVPGNRRGVAAGMRTLLNNTGQTVAVSLALVILSAAMSYEVLTGLFTGASSSHAVDALAFMEGFHRIFLFGSGITAGAIVCSALTGRSDRTVSASTAAET